MYSEKEAKDVTRHWMIEMSGHVVREGVMMSLVCILEMNGHTTSAH